MAGEAAAHPGGMLALATSDPEAIEVALAVGRHAGSLCVAAHNAPDETVLSGDEPAIRAVLAFAASKATRVPTSGAWHSPAMTGALSEWTRALQGNASLPLRCEMVANRTGQVVPPGTRESLRTEGDGADLLRPSFSEVFGARQTSPFDGASKARPTTSPTSPSEDTPSRSSDVVALLAEQLVRPVQWSRGLATVRARADVVVTIGPGAVLRALWHRNFRLSEVTGSAGGPVDPAGESAEQGASGTLEPGLSRLHGTSQSPSVLPPRNLALLDTEGERALGETIATLRGLR